MTAILRKVVFLILIFVFTIAAEAEIFKENQNHCVAWKTKKRMFLVSSVEPIGISCSPEVDLRLGDHNRLQLWVEVETKSFKSGEQERDQEVVKILGEKIVLRTDDIDQDVWRSFYKKPKGQLEMILEIKERKHPIKADYQIKFPEKAGVGKPIVVSGQVKTKFSTLDIEPPSVGGGLVASVKDHLVLYYRFSMEKIEGVDVLMSSKSK